MSWASCDDVVSTLEVVWVRQPDAETGGVSRGDLRGASDSFLVGHERLGECEKRKRKEKKHGLAKILRSQTLSQHGTILYYCTHDLLTCARRVMPSRVMCHACDHAVDARHG
jgi:hypothetical protein